MDICNFRFAEAVQSNILGFPATAMLAIVPLLIVTDVTFRKQNFITCYRRMETFLHKNQLLAAMLAVLILVNWIYLILQN
jgi:hypothetical protein